MARPQMTVQQNGSSIGHDAHGRTIKYKVRNFKYMKKNGELIRVENGSGRVVNREATQAAK